jgi:transposase
VQAGLARRRLERIREIDQERDRIEQEIRERVRALGTGLVELVGVGELIGARIIGEVGDIERIPTRRHFASLNGTAPIPASSGHKQRHRLNRGGNRRLNQAIHMMALTQARMDPRLHEPPPGRRAQPPRRQPRAQAPPLRRRLPAAPPRPRPTPPTALRHRSTPSVRTTLT